MTDYSEAISAMQLDGLQVDDLRTDGGWHRCSAESASGRRNQDGSYKVITLAWIEIVIWSNWKTGVQGKWTSKAERTLSRKERQELEEQLRKEREEERKRREAEQAEAAKLAAWIWERAVPANSNHGYLKRKSVEPGPCRLAADGRLVMPLQDANGKLMSLQFIAPEKREGYTDKLLLKDGKKQGCYCPLPAKEGQEQGPLLIAEGFATAMSLHMATGFEAWVAIDCHNLDAVVKLARSKYPDRWIVVCADYDEPHLPNYTNKGGIGAYMGRKAAERYGAYYALCPVREGRSKADFNDLACDLGLHRVREEIEKVITSGPVTDCIIASDFILREEGTDAGLYWIQHTKGEESKEIRIGDPLKIAGHTRTGEGDNWGLFLEWKDPAGNPHNLAMSKSNLHSQRSDWLPMLTDGGWCCISEYKKQIARYLDSAKPLRQIECATSIGWSGDRFVMPGDETYGPGEGRIILQAAGYNDLYQCSGSLDEWKELAGLCVGNPKLGFALAYAFTGPLLKLAGLEGGIISFEGGSSVGKTTALIAASSVWGKPKRQVNSWRTTDNALEVLASASNDCLLILDELGEVGSRNLDHIVYMLDGGQGKKRAARDGGLRKSYRWTVPVLSSGELGLGDKLLEAGKKSRGGLEARFIAIPVTREDIQDLHGLADSGSLIQEITRLAKEAYGVAGRQFLKVLTEPKMLAEVKRDIGREIDQTVKRLCPENCDGQVQRVALRFAITEWAGQFARIIGILPEEFDEAAYVKTCFTDWLGERGTSGPAEDRAILEQVQRFIGLHGQSRFLDLHDANGICPNCVGYREEVDGAVTYYIFSAVFKSEVIPGYSERRALETLAKEGWIRKIGGRYKHNKRVPGRGVSKFVVLRLPQEEEEDTE